MFLSNALEIGRPIPAPVTLVGAHPAPGFVRLKVIDPLPAKFLTKDRSHFLQAVVDRADPVGASPLILIVGKTQAVIVLDSFAGALRGIFRVGIIIPKPRGFICIHIQWKVRLLQSTQPSACRSHQHRRSHSATFPPQSTCRVPLPSVRAWAGCLGCKPPGGRPV